MPHTVMVIGEGAFARTIADDLADRGAAVVLVIEGSGQDAVERGSVAVREGRALQVRTGTGIVSCRGVEGGFVIETIREGWREDVAVNRVVIAQESERRPNDHLYGLKPSPSVISLGRAMTASDDPDAARAVGLDPGKTAVFLTGLVEESNPLIHEEVMGCALALQTQMGVSTHILTANLKVAGQGLEALHRKSKEAGVVYSKISSPMPVLEQTDGGTVWVRMLDEVVGRAFRLRADVTVVDETIVPSASLSHLAQVFGLHRDGAGFLQSDNVHRLSVATNRAGVLVAGPSRAVQSPGERKVDAACVSDAALALGRDDASSQVSTAEINPGACIRCLTCFRLCPYRAVELETRVAIRKEACAGCGLCVAECPRGAIALAGLGLSEMAAVLTNTGRVLQEGPFVPRLTAFCCTRSAARAWDLARCLGRALPAGLKVVEVPCAGGVSAQHLLAALRGGADGVLVLTCHEGNCHSEVGGRYARERAAHLAETMALTGLGKERLHVRTLASNMGVEFAQVVEWFEERIFALGPSRLNRG